MYILDIPPIRSVFQVGTIISPTTTTITIIIVIIIIIIMV
jgi:hypothetical protein